MKGLHDLNWNELGYARAQISERVGDSLGRPVQGPFTELAAILYSNLFDQERKLLLDRIDSEAPLLSTERLVGVVALLNAEGQA